MTSIAELLVLALERRLNGSFVFETPVSHKSALVVCSGRVTKVRTAEPVEPLGRLLTDSGVIDHATLERGLRVALERKDRLGDALIQLEAVEPGVLESTLREQLGRRLSWLAELPEESAFGFYANVDFLADRPACGAEPLGLIWRCLRDGRGLAPRQEATLSALGTRPLGLRSRAALERFDLSASERASVQSLSQRPLALDGLLAQAGPDTERARRLVYALLLTRQLEPQPASTPAPSLPGARTSPPSRPAPSLMAPEGAASNRGAPNRAEPTANRAEPASASLAPERLEHALERASRLVRERVRAEGAAEASRVMEAVHEHIEKKQFVDAERLARSACKADLGNPEHLALHAWLRMQIGDLGVPALAAQVVAALDRAVMKAPMSVPVRSYRAQVLKRLGRDDEAYRDFRFVARRAPEQLDAVREVRLHLIRARNKATNSGVFSKLFLR